MILNVYCDLSKEQRLHPRDYLMHEEALFQIAEIPNTKKFKQPRKCELTKSKTINKHTKCFQEVNASTFANEYLSTILKFMSRDVHGFSTLISLSRTNFVFLVELFSSS